MSPGGILDVAAFGKSGAYEGTSAEVVGVQPDGIYPSGWQTDVTQQSWGAIERQAGCLFSKWWDEGLNDCDWDDPNDNPAVVPAVDSAVTNPDAYTVTTYAMTTATIIAANNYSPGQAVIVPGVNSTG